MLKQVFGEVKLNTLSFSDLENLSKIVDMVLDSKEVGDGNMLTLFVELDDLIVKETLGRNPRQQNAE